MNAERVVDDLEEHQLFTLPPVGKQAQFHGSNADARCIIAGNQSGKTKAGAREVAFFAVGIHPNQARKVPVPSLGWVVSLDRQFAEEVLLREVLEFIPKSLVKKVNRGIILAIELTNGSRIVFRSFGQGWQAMQGAKIHYAWFDEEPLEKVYDEVMVRLLAHEGPHWVTMTPLQGKTWVFRRIAQPFSRGETDPADLEIFQWDTTQNPTLSEKRVHKVFGKMDKGIRAARMRGDFVDLEGLVFPQFDEKIHVVPEFKLDPNWPIVIGMDYGYRHPFAAIFLAVDEEGRSIVWKTYMRSEALLSQHARAILSILLEYAPHAVDVKAAERVLKAIEEGRVPDERPSIKARVRLDASAKQCKRELLPYGISADDSERDCQARIARLGELLLDRVEGRPGIVFMQGRNGPLIDELRSWSWKKKPPNAGDDKPTPNEPQDVGDDGIDGLGYGLEAMPNRAIKAAMRPPENSPEWLRQARDRANNLARRMGNERIPKEHLLAHLISLRMRRAW